MLSVIKTAYVYETTFGGSNTPELYQVVPAALGGGTVALTVNVFTTSPYAQNYQPWTTKALTVSLTSTGFTAGTAVGLSGRRIRNLVLAATGNQVLFLREGDPTGTPDPAYQMLNVAGETITEGAVDEINVSFHTGGGGSTGGSDYTYNAAPTAFLPGTSTAFVHRAGDTNPNPDTYTSPSATIDLVAVTDGVVHHNTTASGLTGWMDLRGVVPIDATTAWAAAGPLNQTGDSPALTALRMYRLSTTDEMVTTDLTFPQMEYTPIYAGTTAAYPLEIFGQDVGGDVKRYGISYDADDGFSAAVMPLEPIDTAAQPVDVTDGHMTTLMHPASYVAVDDQLFVVRYGYDNTSSPSFTNNTYLRVTQYDGSSGAIVDDVWAADPAPAAGTSQFWQNTVYPAVFYDASLNQLGVATTEFVATSSPFQFKMVVRLTTFQITGYALTQSIRSSGAAFL